VSIPSCRTALLAALAVGVVGCGGASNASSTQPQRQGRGFFSNDPKVVACLKKQGVQPPARPPAGQGQGQARQGRPQGDPARFQRMRAALQKCGVTPPQGGPRPYQQQPPAGN
jgi:hypothetical protein